MRELTNDEFEAVVRALNEAGFSDGIEMAVLFRKGIEMPPEAREVAIEALRKHRQIHGKK